MLCYAMLCYAMLCYAMLCYAMLCYAMLCYAMLCYAVLCYAMLCYAKLLYAMLCYAMLRGSISNMYSVALRESVRCQCGRSNVIDCKPPAAAAALRSRSVKWAQLARS